MDLTLQRPHLLPPILVFRTDGSTVTNPTSVTTTGVANPATASTPSSTGSPADATTATPIDWTNVIFWIVVIAAAWKFLPILLKKL